MKKILLVFCFLLLVVLGFIFNPFQPKDKSPIKAFYYWKNYDYFWLESEILDTLQVRKLYVKYFEVDYDPDLGPIPVSKTELSLSRTEWDYENDREILSKNAKLNIVPTVFILNSVFKEPGLNTREMAKNILHLVMKKYTENMEGFWSPKELQIDCDWTESTKDVYLRFLRQLKEEMKKNSRVEIRKTFCYFAIICLQIPGPNGCLTRRSRHADVLQSPNAKRIRQTKFHFRFG
jgi:hypothetical protein